METKETNSFVCANCGGTLKWNISKQQFECSSCKTPRKIETKQKKVTEHDFSGYAKRAQGEVAFPEKTVMVCSTCGAQIVLDSTATSTVCNMCGSSHVLESKQTNGVPPDGVIPFQIDKYTAQQNFKKWVKSRWFAPNRLKEAYQDGKLEGMFLPFWTFDIEAEADYEGRGGKESEDKDGKKKVSWTNVSGNVSVSVDDLPICASEGQGAKVIEDILPYDTEGKTVPYASAYLSGFSAEHYAFGADKAVGQAKKRVEDSLRDKAKSRIREKYDQAEVKKMDVTYHDIGYKHVLLPAWVSAFGYNGKQYTYIINGETGEVGGERPYSVPKIVIAVLIALIVIFGIYNMVEGAELEEPYVEGYYQVEQSQEAAWIDFDVLD